MENEVVKYAPKAVIEELDNFEGTPSDLFSEDEGILLKLSKTSNWVFLSAVAWQKEREIAVYNHVFGDKRLQPERENRYYVEGYDGDDDRTIIHGCSYLPVEVTFDNVYVPNYEGGIDYETAAKAQALYGGTIKEIK